MELAKIRPQSLNNCPLCGPDLLEKISEGKWRCSCCNGEFHLPDSAGAASEESDECYPEVSDATASEAIRQLLDDRRIVSEELLERTVRQRDCRLCMMVLDAPIPVMIQTADGQVLGLSRTFTDLTGYTLEEIPDEAAWLRLACRVPENQLQSVLDARLHSEKPQPEEHAVFTHDGDKRTWKFYASPDMTLFDGSVLKVRMAVDVTDQKRSELQLAEANDRLCSLFSHAPVGMAIFEARSPHRIAAHNPAYLKVWPDEFQEEGIVGRNVLELLPAHEQGRVREVFREVLETRQPKTIHEFYHLCPRRGGTWWNWNLTPVFEHDEVIAFIHMLAEVTDTVRSRDEMTHLVESQTAELRKAKEGLEKQVERRRRAQQILRRHMELHRTIIDNIPVMLIFYDPDGRFQLLNREFCKLTGWRPDEIRKMDNPLEVFYPDPQVRRKALEFMRKDSKDWAEFPIMTKHGERIDSLWTNMRLSDGSQIGIGLDMRQRLEAEKELEGLNRDLNRRAEQLHFLALEVTEAEDRERRRLAELLHDDLQQMLVAAKYQLNFIREGAAGEAKLKAEIDDLLQILNESIAKTRGLSHELSPPALHQESLARALTVLAQQMKEKHGLEVQVEALDDYKSPVDNIKSFIFKAVQEMLLNIIKHAGTDRAHVKLWQKSFEFNVCVSDEGRGFDAAALEQWNRSPNGMGLFKIQERVRLMGGSCQVVSEPGQGTSITLSLPVRQAPRRMKKFHIVDKPEEERSASTGRPRQDDDPRKIRIVLADDHDVVRKGIASLLIKEVDIEIVGQASNGRQAVELAKQLHPDLILMDVAMPQLDGLEATRLLQSENPDIKIVALSMFDKKDMAEQLLKAGAMLYLNKSDAFEELLGAIRKIMGSDSAVLA